MKVPFLKLSNPTNPSSWKINRANHLRSKPQNLDEAFWDPKAKFVMFGQDLDPLIHKSGHKLVIQQLPSNEKQHILHKIQGKSESESNTKLNYQHDIVFLGLLEHQHQKETFPFFALDQNMIGAEQIQRWKSDPDDDFVNTRAATAELSELDANIVAQSRSLLHWHRKSSYCSNCGHKTKISFGGSERECTNCGNIAYPPISPAVIMLIFHQNSCLLARQKQWRSGQYSTLAGFMEPGESIEDTVRREALEEATVDIDDIVYFASQPWPFPNSLMLACYARARNSKFAINDKELEHGRWFDVNEVKLMLQKHNNQLPASVDPQSVMNLPNSYSVSHQLIKYWTENRTLFL